MELWSGARPCAVRLCQLNRPGTKIALTITRVALTNATDAGQQAVTGGGR